MKPVLFVSATGVMGGAEIYLIRLMRALRATSLSCSAVVPAPTPLSLRLTAAGLDWRGWPAPLQPLLARSAGGGRIRRVATRISGLLAAPAANRWVESLRAGSRGIIHLNATRVAFLAGNRAQTVAEVKDALTQPFFGPRVARLIAGRLESAAEVAVANSGFIAEHLVTNGYPAQRVVTILNGLDLDRLRPLPADQRDQVRAAQGWGPREFVICCVGRLAAWKGQALAIRALARLRAGLPQARLVLIGDTGFDGNGYARLLTETARELGVDGATQLLGYRDDAHRLMAASDVVLHTSIHPEPLGLTPMEAQALGVPVVASRAGGVLETVIHGESGYLFEPGSTEDLCRGLEWAAGCERAAVAHHGRARAEASFDMREVVQRYRELYANL